VRVYGLEVRFFVLPDFGKITVLSSGEPNKTHGRKIIASVAAMAISSVEVCAAMWTQSISIINIFTAIWAMQFKDWI